MPEGFGLNSSLSNRAAMPFFSYNGFVYCYSDSFDFVQNERHRRIFRVNANTNEVILVSGEIADVAVPSNMKVYNNEVYFTTSDQYLFKINNTTNAIEYIASCEGNYIFYQDFIYLEGPISSMYNLNDHTVTPILLSSTSLTLSLSNFYVYNGQFYCTGGVTNSTEGNNMIFNVEGPTATLIYTAPGVLQFSVFDNKREPVRFNDNLLYLTKVFDSVDYWQICSFNLTSNIANPDYFYYFNTCCQSSIVKPYVYNDQVYITRENQLFLSNTVSSPIPAFDKAQFGRDTFSPYPGTSSEDYVFFNSEIYGKKNTNNAGFQDFLVSDFTLDGTQFLNTPSQTGDYNSAFIHNNKMYYYKNYDVNSIYVNDGLTTQTVYTIPFPLTNFGSSIFANDNDLFVAISGGNQEGLYKIDSTLLAVNQFNKSKIVVFPNPTSSILYVQSNETIQSIKFTDVSGRITFVRDGSKDSIDVSGLSNGIYFVEVKTVDNIFTEKFIKN